MNNFQGKIFALAIALVIALTSFGFFYGATHNFQMTTASTPYKPSNDTLITVDTTLSANMVTNNLTINANAVLTTNGYQIFCNGTFTNYGAVVAGPAPVMDYPNSYGGSGGGGWEVGNATLAATSGYSTIAAGGLGSDQQYGAGGSGHSVTLSSINRTLITQWFSGNIENYTSGGSGQSAAGLQGGSGSYGLYIQAKSIINNGLVSVAGSTGRATASGIGFSGGGGGGLIIMAYRNVISIGTINAQGGGGAFINGANGVSGAGGSGQFLTLHYMGSPPINQSNVPELVLPSYAFVGAYVNYSVVKTSGVQYSNTSYNMSITSVSRENQTFTFKENVPTFIGPIGTTRTYHYTISFSGPVIFPVLSPSELIQLKNGMLPQDVVALSSQGNVTPNIVLKLQAGTFNTYRIGFYLSGHQDYMWVDEQTGLIIKETSTGAVNLTTSLAATNIIEHSKKSVGGLTYLALGAGIASAIVIAALFLMRFRNGSEGEGDVRLRLLQEANMAARTRSEELKEMLERGVIDRDFYEDSISRLNKKNKKS